MLILLPSYTHKLLNTWIGPDKVVALTRPHSCLVQMEDGSTRELQISKPRPYISRVDYVGVVFDQDSDFGELHYVPTDKETQPNNGIELNQMPYALNSQQKHQLRQLLQQYEDIFRNHPGKANVKGHSVKVTVDSLPKRLQPYKVPIALQKEVECQVNELLDMDLIEHSDSDWAHPVVCGAKMDGSIRLCIDFRLLNSFTIPDAYPMKHVTYLIYEIGKTHFISVLDLTKGYWQIPMEENSKHFTAFVTHSGHYQWKVLPLGMKNAGSTFQKSMDKVLSPHHNYCRSYIDDVAVFSETWSDHMQLLEGVFKTLRAVGQTVNLEKCDFGKSQVKFLGHLVGFGKHAPDPQKVETMSKLLRPTTKKQLRGLIGLASYYRDYINNFSSIVLPLTNLTKKNIPNNIPWVDKAEESFQCLKKSLIEMPTLYTPVLNRPFQLYTDASATIVGCMPGTER
ncbi:retrovirus-related Pol polyprotein from transposon 17.6 [Trichonephila clavipes]|nr:retrovirus-related Pol polyprotein from transposon 17.6 [Trichonephila clavipes]